MKQETLEEAAQKRFPINHNLSILERMGLNSAANMGFIEGAKWQQERSYSEEEVLKLLIIKEENTKDSTKYNGIEYITPEEWFEQFKKK